MANKPNESIVEAAVHFPKVNNGSKLLPIDDDCGIVICAKRHFVCLEIFKALMGYTPKKEDCISGFVTDSNRFVCREEGARIAWSAGQVKTKCEQLYSEHINPFNSNVLNQDGAKCA